MLPRFVDPSHGARVVARLNRHCDADFDSIEASKQHDRYGLDPQQPHQTGSPRKAARVSGGRWHKAEFADVGRLIIPLIAPMRPEDRSTQASGQ